MEHFLDEFHLGRLEGVVVGELDHSVQKGALVEGPILSYNRDAPFEEVLLIAQASSEGQIVVLAQILKLLLELLYCEIHYINNNL